MKPVSIEITATLPGPPKIVWDLITDWEHQGDWMLEAKDFVVTSSRREGVGVEAEAKVTFAGITTRDRVRVVGWEPPRRLAIEHRGWVRGRGEIDLAPRGEGETLVRWREELHPPLGVIGALGMRALRPLLERTFRRDAWVLGGLVRAAARR